MNLERDVLTIVGWLWRDPECKAQYRPEHANIWARMIHRNLTMPHRFILMTDDFEPEFDPLITPVMLWPDASELRKTGTVWAEGRPQCFRRLRAFSRGFGDILNTVQGFKGSRVQSDSELNSEQRERLEPLNLEQHEALPRFVSIDLDCVVLDSLDPLFDRSEDFVIYRRPAVSKYPGFNPYNGSMWMMTAGARAQVWDDFEGEKSIAESRQFLGTDQAWIRHKLGPDEAGWGIDDGVVSWSSVQGDNQWLAQPPPETRIIFFNTDEKPWDYIVPKQALCQHCAEPAAVQWPFKVVRERTPPPSHQWIERFYK